MLALAFVERVKVFQTGMGKQVGHGVGVLAGMLAQIQRHQVKAEYRGGAHQIGQRAFRQRAAAVAAEGLVDGAQIGQKSIGIGIRRQQAEAAAEGEPQGVGAAHQPRQNIGHGAAVGLFFAGAFGVGRGGRHGQHCFAYIDAAAG